MKSQAGCTTTAVGYVGSNMNWGGGDEDEGKSKEMQLLLERIVMTGTWADVQKRYWGGGGGIYTKAGGFSGKRH